MENPKKSIFAKPLVQSLSGMLIIIALVAGFLFYKSIKSYIKVDNSTISAPIISISPETSGTLDEIYVKNGENVTIGQPLARVGAEILKSKIDGVIIYTNNTPGQVFNSSSAIIKMIDPKEMRVIGSVKENAGLSKIKVGNPVSFTLDAYDGQKFTGIVEEIASTSKDSSIVFSISDKRELKEFTIKVKYDTSINSEFKNGMSAKMKIYNK